MATQAATSPAVGTAEISRPARSLWKDAWFTFTRDKLAIAGLFVFAFLVVAVLIGPNGSGKSTLIQETLFPRLVHSIIPRDPACVEIAMCFPSS